jgi:(R,R)-butanediol dehydrogenase/meso-butanediol dehydrogenase/diacetyl reductase
MRSKLSSGETVGIVGCGPIGLIALQVAKAAGASKVIAFEMVKSRQEMAKKLGVDLVINPEDEKAMESVNESTDGVGPDVVIECVGSEKATQLAINIARRGGRVSIIGIAHKIYKFNFNDIVFNEREVYGSCATTGGFPTAIQYLRDGRVNTESLITGKILLKNLVTKGYEELLRNPVENFKILVTPDETLLTES